MGFDLNVTIPTITVFLQGLLSFFSPCILPIIPLYMGYLSGGTISTNEDGSKNFSQKKVILNTLFFIIGVSFAFFILGIGFSAAGKFFVKYQLAFSRIGGILIILLGLIQMGILEKPFKGKEFKLPIKINMVKVNPITALIMGFVFSFAWTPCVGPALSTVLIMISSAKSMANGILLMAIYTLGFTIPFLLLGIFTIQCLNFFKKHRGVVKYTVKVGGILMILMGVMMLTGIMNGITGYLSNFDNNTPNNEISQNQKSEDQNKTNENNTNNNSVNSNDDKNVKAIDFELFDQFGNKHKLSDYKGKVVFLNFWATWCPPCKSEMPDIQKLYENYGYNKNDVIILGVATPSSKENINSQEQDSDYVISFLKKNNYSYPSVLDISGKLEREYGISAYPTTFMINSNGNVAGYLPGMMSYDIMESIIKQTINTH